MKDEKLVFSAKEAADALGISRQTLREGCRREGFPAAKIGRRIFIPRDKLKAWLEAQAEGRI